MAFYGSSESDEWYTPKRYTTLVEQVFDEPIDLDPCSCFEANEYVNASRWFGAKDNSLGRSWEAKNVFLNPPFSAVDYFSQKLITEFCLERFPKAILLCNAATSERWFRKLYDFPVCFTNHRIKFHAPEGYAHKLNPEKTACLLNEKFKGMPRARNTKGQAFVFIGDRIYHDRFRDYFRGIGTVVKKI